MTSRRIVIDTDIGLDPDDAIALAVAAASRELEIVRVTTTGSRAPVRAAIARRLLDLAGRQDVPVVAGTSTPGGAWAGHEGRGLLTADEIEAMSQQADGPGIAALGADTTLVTIGPLTNVPRMQRAPATMVAMAGCIGEPHIGDAPIRGMEEFNANQDRDATRAVWRAAPSMTLIPLDVTIRTFFTDDDLDALRAGPPCARAVAALVTEWVPILRRMLERAPETKEWVCNLHDPLAIVCLLRPELVSIERTPVALAETAAGLRTVRRDDGLEMDLVVDADVERVRAFVLERVLAA